MTYIIAEPCVDLLDKACIEECPVDCIYEGNRMLYIHPDECVDCGACEPVCPVEAIFYEDDVPEQWKDYTGANYEFFEDLGSPGGASKVGKIDKDAPVRRRPAAAGERALTRHRTRRTARSAGLPDFPWDLLEPAKAAGRRRTRTASSTSPSARRSTRCPAVIRQALAAASDAPGYPLTAGTPGAAGGDRRLGGPRRGGGRARPARRCCPRSAPRNWSRWLPTLLGLGPGDTVVIPSVCYPTYEVGARLAGADAWSAPTRWSPLGPARVRLVWVNSPGNPTGRVLPAAHLRKVVDWARERGAVVASDECYLTLGWEAEPVSVLSRRLRRPTTTGVLAVHSLSKRSNLAGYRAGFVAGDPALVAELLAVRKHAGMIVPAPVQAAMVAALGDEAHVDEQRDRYAARRDVLRARSTAAGFTIEHSEAGLYLWATRGEDCWATVDWLADARHPGRAGRLLRPGRRAGTSGSR